MRPWLLLIGGMLVWTVHFFGLYALASIFGSGSAARIGTILLTALCLAADAAILLAALRWARGDDQDEASAWSARVGVLIAALSAVAVIWQGLPAVLA